MIDDFDISPHDDNYDDDNNASDKSFMFDDDEFEAAIENENILENLHGISDNEVQANFYVKNEEESNVDLDDGENQEVGDPRNQEV